MTEFIRSVSVRIEVDTNKQTLVLDRSDVEIDEVERVVREFIEKIAQ